MALRVQPESVDFRVTDGLHEPPNPLPPSIQCFPLGCRTGRSMHKATEARMGSAMGTCSGSRYCLLLVNGRQTNRTQPASATLPSQITRRADLLSTNVQPEERFVRRMLSANLFEEACIAVLTALFNLNDFTHCRAEPNMSQPGKYFP